ncbi:MAPEG family protein [Allosphingosinicella flava]|uniref:MAPEG family protein n=1 Tax=Allosphingosinicella flava TaxID=2771430 RepID=A0A7T2GI49_9SPHN|nr:MAPEG family protein [Sphingosinicella flava]QPQ54316.1 MAPEG family protein [Sphingosinicella flava]
MILPITLTIAGAAALLNFWLSWRVGQMRRHHKVLIGDGGAQALTARMRAQANFVEYAPFYLILLGLVEMGAGSATWLWIVSILFILGRILHAFGMDKGTLNRLRIGGMILTMLPLLALAIYAITLAYAQPVGGEMRLVPSGDQALPSSAGGTKLN